MIYPKPKFEVKRIRLSKVMLSRIEILTELYGSSRMAPIIGGGGPETDKNLG
jgi:hypothetical protein